MNYCLKSFTCLLFAAGLPLVTLAQTGRAMPAQAVRDFAAAINTHDTGKIAALMSSDHQFTDMQGNIVNGRKKMMAGWAGYLKWFPNYRIELESVVADGQTVLATGFASGIYRGLKTADGKAHWRLPTAWKAVVQDGKIKVWQVYADTKIPFDIMAAHAHPAQEAQGEKRIVTGIGGIFFKCKDPEVLKEWYRRHLGLKTDKYGTNFEWYQGADSTKKGATQWSPFAEQTKYFEPSTKDFMLNYRVINLEALVAQLTKDGVTVVDKIEAVDYGKFVHIMDPEGNKIELWEPVDEVYEKMEGGRTK